MMNAASLVSRRLLLASHARSSRVAFSTSAARVIPAAFANAADESASSTSSAAWVAAAAAGAMLMGASGSSSASCEKRRKTNVVDPHAYPSSHEDTEQGKTSTCESSSTDAQQPIEGLALKDPMTVFAKQAVKMEVKQEESTETPTEKEQEETNKGKHTVSKAQTTATSPNTEAAKLIGKRYLDEMSVEELKIEEATRKAKQHSGGLKIFSGNGNMALALEITRHLGINMGKATVGRFADGEANIVIQENIRGKDVYVIQPTCPPVNDNMMELLLMVSTLRRASARRITVVIPYYGYARQDRKMQARVPISAADVARLMEAMGIDRVIAVDLHCGQIQGFFGPRVPVDNLDGGIVGLDYFGSKDLHNPVVVSPDAGGVYRAKKFKEGLAHKYDMEDIGLAMIVKQRARAGTVDQMDLVGDVRNCDCILVDDMIDTAGTLCKAADVLVANGARRVFAFASHGLLSGPGNERIAASKMEEVVILNTIPTSPQRQANEKLTELSVAPLLAQAIFNIHAKKSISALFK